MNTPINEVIEIDSGLAIAQVEMTSLQVCPDQQGGAVITMTRGGIALHIVASQHQLTHLSSLLNHASQYSPRRHDGHPDATP